MHSLLALLIAGLTATCTSVAAAELVMVEEHGCVWCEAWNDEVAPIYPKTAEGEYAPLRRIDMHEPLPMDIEFASRPVFTPTFVLVDNGQELGRIEGYPGEDFFWGLLERMLFDHTNYVRPSS
jgi:hypothetical protein